MTDRKPLVVSKARIAAAGTTLALMLFLFAGRVWLIPSHVSTDPDEGWNAFQALRAFGAGPLYPPPGSLTGNNYPPLSFFIVGGFGRLIGDDIVAGRILAFVSVLLVSALILAAVRRVGGRSGFAPMVGVLLFLGFNATSFRSYLAMNDPQWLGHVFMTAGLVLLLATGRDVPIASGRVVMAALLVLTGGFIKHNLVAFPLAATVWLLIQDRRAFAVWIATSALGLALAFSLLHEVYGPVFLADLLAADRHYSWSRLVMRSAGPIVVMLPMIVVTLQLFRIRGTDRRIDLLLLMAVISVPLGIVERSGQGVDRNAHFEALVALSIATAVSLARCGLPWKTALPWLILPFLVLLPGAFRDDVRDLLHRADREAVWRVMQDRVAAISGPVACQTSAICYWAGKNFEIDFFLYGQRLAIRRDASALTQALAEHRFAAIELDRGAVRPAPGEIPDPLAAIVLRSYRPVLVDGNGRRLLLPAGR